MPVQCHALLHDDLRPQDPNGERILLVQRARGALANEREQGCRDAGRHRRGTMMEGGTHIASLRVACAIGLLLVSLCTIASKASAMPPRVIVDDAELPPRRLRRVRRPFGRATASTGRPRVLAPALPSRSPCSSPEGRSCSAGAERAGRSRRTIATEHARIGHVRGRARRRNAATAGVAAVVLLVVLSPA